MTLTKEDLHLHGSVTGNVHVETETTGKKSTVEGGTVRETVHTQTETRAPSREE